MEKVVSQLYQVLLLSWAALPELPLGELWRQFRAWVAVPLLRLAVFICLVMSMMVLVEKVSMGLITLYAKVFRRRPARIYKCDPLTEDEEMGSLAFPMVLVQIPMYNEKEVYQLSIGAACNMVWPSDRIIIQVLDDSTDPLIKELVKKECEMWSERGKNIRASFAATELGRLFPSLLATPRNPRPVPSPLGRSPETLVSFSSSIRAAPAALELCARNGRAPVVAEGTKHLIGSLTKTEGLKFAVVVARFNEIITNLLLEGALETFQRYSVDDDDITVVKVPGSFEVPVVAQRLGKSGKFDAILCIGAVIRGDTSHYDAVANSAASGVLNAGLSSGVPCIFGVLTCDDMDQALNRAGGKSGNKGAEAALTAIEMASLFKHHLLK